MVLAGVCSRPGCRSRRVLGLDTCVVHRVMSSDLTVDIPVRQPSLPATEILSPSTTPPASLHEAEKFGDLRCVRDAGDSTQSCGDLTPPVSKRRRLDYDNHHPFAAGDPSDIDGDDEGPPPLIDIADLARDIVDDEGEFKEENPQVAAFRSFVQQASSSPQSFAQLLNTLSPAARAGVSQGPPCLPKRKRSSKAKSTSASSSAPASRQYRHWSVTIQGVEDSTLAKLQDPEWLQHHGIDIVSGQPELAPTTGKPHLQLYIQTTKPARFEQFTDLAVFADSHWEPREKPHDFLYKYVHKLETRMPGHVDFECRAPGASWDIYVPAARHGVGQGARSDLVTAAEFAARNEPLSALADAGLPHVAIRNHSGYNALRRAYLHTRTRALPEDGGVPTRTVVYVGSPGAGKTRAIRQLYKDVNKSQVWCPAIGHDQIDLRGYEGHLVMHFDEHVPTIDNLKVISDDGPGIARVLYGDVPILATSVYITMNRHVTDWWHLCEDIDLLAILRRIDEYVVWTGTWPNAVRFTFRPREMYMSGVHILHYLNAVRHNAFMLSAPNTPDMSFYTGKNALCTAIAWHYVPIGSQPIDLLM